MSPRIQTIYGKDGQHRVPYLTRFRLRRPTHSRLGLYLHYFHRGDNDRDYHDHPWGFWTWPLRSYCEDVLTDNGTELKAQFVRRRQWHWRPATHAHRICNDRSINHFPMWTLVLPTVSFRDWGFYVEKLTPLAFRYGSFDQQRGDRVWVPWERYVY